MLELVDVGFDEPKVAAMAQLEIDFFADEPAHQHLQIGQNIAQLQNLRPQGLAARKGQELPHQRGRAVGVLLDLIDVLKRRVGRPVIGEQQIGIADDRGQDIVEIMCHAAGKLSDRLHLLRLREIVLQRALLSRVERINRRTIAVVLFGRRDKQSRRALAVSGEANIDRWDIWRRPEGRGNGGFERRRGRGRECR